MNILVIGDSCKDVFIYGDIERISPEAPVPVFKPTHEESNGGMARNVADNVESLDMHIHTVTNKNSIIKKRYVENRSGQMVLRVDEHDYCERIEETLLKGITKNKFERPPLNSIFHPCKIPSKKTILLELSFACKIIRLFSLSILTSIFP